MKILFTFLMSGCAILSFFSTVHAETMQETQTYSQTKPLQWFSNYSDAVAEAKTSSKPIVILFTGTGWCPACMKLEKEVINHPEFAKKLSEKFVFFKAEFPASGTPAPLKSLLDRYQVKEFPTFIITNADGELVRRIRYRQGGPHAYLGEFLQNSR